LRINPLLPFHFIAIRVSGIHWRDLDHLFLDWQRRSRWSLSDWWRSGGETLAIEGNGSRAVGV
jgi:hypothetical protein